MTIGKRLKEERERLGLSQTALGELGGFGKTTVIAWERGTAFPNALFLADIAGIGADVGYIVTGERNGPPPLKPDERELIALYRSASLTGKAAAVGALRGAESAKQVQKVSSNNGQITQSGSIFIDRGATRKK